MYYMQSSSWTSRHLVSIPCLAVACGTCWNKRKKAEPSFSQLILWKKLISWVTVLPLWPTVKSSAVAVPCSWRTDSVLVTTWPLPRTRVQRTTKPLSPSCKVREYLVAFESVSNNVCLIDVIQDATVASETDNEIVMLLPLHTVKLFPTLLRRIEEEINTEYVLFISPTSTL